MARRVRPTSYLVVSRKKHEKLRIGEDVEITILELGQNRVRFGINAPKHVKIHTRLKTGLIPPSGEPNESEEIEFRELKSTRPAT